MSVCVSPSALPTPTTTAIQNQDDTTTPCPQCPKSFTSTKLMLQHQQMFHSDKAFICETCGKAFRFRSNLAEHRSVHTALKPYVCKFCGKSSRLKGNLTKHILKHHKKEQNESIGKDDIIIKKESVATADINMIDSSGSQYSVITTPLLNGNSTKEEQTDHERSILLSLGLEYTNSLDLRDSPETSVSPDVVNVVKNEIEVDSEGYDNVLVQNTVGGETSLAALIAQVSSSPSSNKSPVSHNGAETQCGECGKHVRKSSYLPIHMTLHHGFPPPEPAHQAEEKSSDNELVSIVGDENQLQAELRTIATAICELKGQPNMPIKMEQQLAGLDNRISRLEKNLDMALNSIYTLVQLQTGMSSSLNRLKDDTTGNLGSIKQLLEMLKESIMSA